MNQLPSLLLRRIGCTLACLLACVCAFSMAFTPLRTSHDEFWHVKSGQWIAQHGLPQNDIFTYTAADTPWYNHEWIAQIGFWKVYDLGEASGLGGWRALILLKTLFILLAFVGFGAVLAWGLPRQLHHPLWAMMAAAVCVALARRTFYPRPPFITYLLMAVLMWLLMAWRAGGLRRRWLALLPPLFALWANLHGGWSAGLVVLAAFGVDSTVALVIAFLARKPWTEPLRDWLALSATGLACGLATLVNPSGYHLYDVFGNVFNDPYLLSCIGELMPPDWHFVWVLEGVILTMAAAALRPVRPLAWLGTLLVGLGLHFALRASANPWMHTAIALPIFAAAIFRYRRPGWVAHLLLVCFFAQQGIHHVRHLSLLAVVLLPSLAWALDGWAHHVRARLGDQMRRAPMLAGFTALAGLTFFWLAGGLEIPRLWERNVMLFNGMWSQPSVAVRSARQPVPGGSSLPDGVYEVEAYPEKAVDFLLRAQLPAPLFNGGNYAGYLMWRLSPEHYKVFTDNRYDIYGGRFIRQEHSVMNGWTSDWLESQHVGADQGFYPWDEVLDRWDVQTLFLPVGAPLNGVLPQVGEWTLVWEDYSFKIWVRDTPPNHAVIQRALSMPRPLPWIARLQECVF